jgi:transposase InsO family protein
LTNWNAPWAARRWRWTFLTDNGPEFIADLLQQLLTWLGLIAGPTPRRRPQANGLGESCFGSFERDWLSHQPGKLWPTPGSSTKLGSPLTTKSRRTALWPDGRQLLSINNR